MPSAPANDDAQRTPGCSKCCCSVRGVLKSSALIVVAAIAIVLIAAATRPDMMNVSRSATMAATPAAVFEQVNDFHKWEAWSPWVKIDPHAQTSFEGPTSGEGAKFHWAGNNEVGEGSMTITESKSPEHVRIRLDFVKPMAGTSDVLMQIEPQGEQTKLTWSMSGKMSYMAKIMSLFMDCDKMVGDYYEKGLANMKSIVETKPEQPSGA